MLTNDDVVVVVNVVVAVFLVVVVVFVVVVVVVHVDMHRRLRVDAGARRLLWQLLKLQLLLSLWLRPNRISGPKEVGQKGVSESPEGVENAVAFGVSWRSEKM